MVEISDISFSYPGSKEKIFSDFSLKIEANRIYGLLGKNGTGKSTLLYLICGLLRQSHGMITFDGMDTRLRRPEMLEEIFVVPEEFELPPVSLQQYLDIYSPFYPRFNNDVFTACLADFGVAGVKRLNELSMGQKKKVFMSFALATGTKLLLMDEPTNGLDIPSKSQFRKVMARNMTDERTLIVATHQVHDVESLLDHILILSDSQLLLNASTSEITDKYVFECCQPSEMDGSVVYAEPTLQGNAVIAKRSEAQAETQINLELLFTAATKGMLM